MFLQKKRFGTGLVLVRERFSFISAAVSIRSKPNSRFQTLCFSCISKRRICPRRCVAAHIVALTSSDILAKQRFLTVIFKNQIKNAVARVHLTWSLQRSPVKSRLSRVPWLRIPRARSTGASYTWRSPCSALGRFLGRVYSAYSSCTSLLVL